MKTIYIMLTKTESVFCYLIKRYTHEPYAHVSLLFNDDFTCGYSFSRKKVRNPFIGGFKEEDYVKWVAAFPKTECQMYELTISDTQYTKLLDVLSPFLNEPTKYKYNILGVIGRLFHIKIEPKHSYFCSQFVSYILSKADIIHFDKKPILTTAKDFRTHSDLNLIYEGFLNALLDDPQGLVSSYITQQEELYNVV
ncbi:MAG: hypothetical protein RR448_00785 [Niameybacter sp.]|uniref:hypothetical protein n=1 Tax=Niameybacter sp. TaxID=2033640 RepID=UPI002FCB53CA